MGSLLIIADNGLNYSINQTSREMLFVPTSSDAQYKARAFTNMFIQRLAKGAAMVVSAVFILIGIRWLSPITLVITVAWIWLAILAGRGFRRLAGSKEPVSSELVAESCGFHLTGSLARIDQIAPRLQTKRAMCRDRLHPLLGG